MRTLGAGIVLYLLFLAQAATTPYLPDLVLVSLIVFAFHESRVAATLLGAFCGICLDVVTPGLLGTNQLVLTVTGYVAASTRALFYRGSWFVPLLTLVALAFKWLVFFAARALPATLLPMAVSSALTIALGPIVAAVLTLLFYPRWSPGSTD